MSKVLDAKKAIAKKYKVKPEEMFPDLTSGKALDVPAIPAPCATINALTGIGGFPRGRITEIYGPEATGKTTLGIEIIAEAQRRDPEAVAMFLDYEHAFDHRYARALGVDLRPERFIFSQPETMEEGVAILDLFVSEGLVDIGVVDSVAAMNPRSFQEGELDKNAAKGTSHVGQVGLKAQLMSGMLNRLKSQLSGGRKPAMIFLNQTRTRMNMRFGTAYQDATGGQAMKYYASVRIELGRAEGEGGERATGPIERLHDRVRVRMTCVKNKVGPPWLRSAMVIGFGTGISNVESVADLAEMYLGVKRGAWYSYDGGDDETRFRVQGRDGFVDLLATRPGLLNHLEEKSLEKLRKSNEEPVGKQAVEDREEDHDPDEIVLSSEDPAETESGDGLTVVDA